VRTIWAEKGHPLQERVLVEKVVVDPYAATLPYDFETSSTDHASHESPGTKAEPEAYLQEEQYYRWSDRCHCRRGFGCSEY